MSANVEKEVTEKGAATKAATSSMREDEIIDEEEERKRIQRIKARLARKKWVINSDDEDESSEDDEPRLDESGNYVAGHKAQAAAMGGKGQQDPQVGDPKAACAEVSSARGEEKSIEYLLKTYYKTEARTDDLVKVGDKWVLKSEAENQEQGETEKVKVKEKKSKRKKKENKQDTKEAEEPKEEAKKSARRSEKKELMTSKDRERDKDRERGKENDESNPDTKEREKDTDKDIKEREKNKERESKSKKERSKIVSPPLSPRGLLSFARDKKNRASDKGASQPSTSPIFNKKASPGATPSADSRKRASTQSLVPVAMSEDSVEGSERGDKGSNGNGNKKKKKKERRRSLGIHFLSSDNERMFRGSVVAPSPASDGLEDPRAKRWSGGFEDHRAHTTANAGTTSTPGLSSSANNAGKKEERKKIATPTKMPSLDSNLAGGSGKPKKGSKPTSPGGSYVAGLTSPRNRSSSTVDGGTAGETPPQAPPPPVVASVPQNHSGKTLARELSEVYCYSDRRDPDFREEMLRREEDRKKLLEMKKDIQKTELEMKRQKKESLKDENKKAKWGLLFSLPQDVRKLKEELPREEGDGDDDDDGTSNSQKCGMSEEEVESRLRELNLHLERTISQLLLVDPEEGERLLAQKRAEEAKRKKLLEQDEEEG